MPFHDLLRPCRCTIDNTNTVDNSLFRDHEGVYDIDFQHDLHVGESQELVWGLGYRSIQDSNDSSSTVSLQPNHSWLNQYQRLRAG